MTATRSKVPLQSAVGAVCQYCHFCIWESETKLHENFVSDQDTIQCHNLSATMIALKYGNRLKTQHPAVFMFTPVRRHSRWSIAGLVYPALKTGSLRWATIFCLLPGFGFVLMDLVPEFRPERAGTVFHRPPGVAPPAPVAHSPGRIRAL